MSLQGVVSLQVQDFALAEFPKGAVGPFLQPVWVHLDGSPAHRHISWCPRVVSCVNLMSAHSSRALFKVLGSTGPTVHPCIVQGILK